MIKIYVGYFSDARKISNEILTPMQVGRALSSEKLDMLGDDTGPNISAENPSFCELTGIYWAWKNDTVSAYVGFMHYRRFLDFQPDVQRANDSIHGVIVDRFEAEFVPDYGLNSADISKVVQDADIVVPKPIDVRDMGSPDLEQQYRLSPEHHIQDFRLAGQIISEIYPEDHIFFRRMAKGSILYPCNIFVMRRDVFHQYCEWVFPILSELDRRIDTTGYSDQARRAVGYLAERLFTTFMLRMRATAPSLKVTELRMVILKDTSPEPKGPEKPTTDRPVVSVVASTDQAYLPHLAALISSVFDNAKPTSFIDFIVLDGGLSKDERWLLTRIPAKYPTQGRVVFTDMSKQFLDVETHSYFTRSTFYRLMLPEILSSYNRVLYLDSDMIVLGDVSELFAVDLHGRTVGAVRDLVMRTFVARGVPAIREAGGRAASLYLSDYLGMKRSSDEYFQAGTIVFDLKRMRERDYSAAMRQDLSDNRYWFLDQDVLNKHLVGDVEFLDPKWNTLYIDDEGRKFLSAEELRSYKRSFSEPAVLHFAGITKPWINGDHPFGHYYWYYLRGTHWYEGVFSRFVSGGASLFGPLPSNGSRGLSWRILSKAWRNLPAGMRRRLLPLGIKVSHGLRR